MSGRRWVCGCVSDLTVFSSLSAARAGRVVVCRLGPPWPCADATRFGKAPFLPASKPPLLLLRFAAAAFRCCRAARQASPAIQRPPTEICCCFWSASHPQSKTHRRSAQSQGGCSCADGSARRGAKAAHLLLSLSHLGHHEGLLGGLGGLRHGQGQDGSAGSDGRHLGLWGREPMGVRGRRRGGGEEERDEFLFVLRAACSACCTTMPVIAFSSPPIRPLRSAPRVPCVRDRSDELLESASVFTFSALALTTTARRARLGRAATAGLAAKRVAAAF